MPLCRHCKLVFSYSVYTVYLQAHSSLMLNAARMT